MSDKDKPMSAEEAADILQRIANDLRILDYIDEDDVVYALAIAALREKAARENPKPLTRARLRSMDGEPVWVRDEDQPCMSGWGIVDESFRGGEVTVRGTCRGNPIIHSANRGFLTSWFAYAHEPRGEVPHDAE